jgi:hypothetical protein
VPVGESCEVQPAFVLDSTTIDNITAVCPSQFATCDAPHAGCVDGLAEMIQTGSVMLSPVASQTLADLSALSYCAALFLRPPPMFDTQILPAGTNTSSVCELDAVTDCCIGTDQCPATCNAHSHITETTFGPYGQPQEILRCVCDECGLDFPDEYPVDESTWCQVLGFGFCNGMCATRCNLRYLTAADHCGERRAAHSDGRIRRAMQDVPTYDLIGLCYHVRHRCRHHHFQNCL